MTRPHCAAPDDCKALGPVHCQTCARRHRRPDRVDPEAKAFAKRFRAREAVKLAGLPLFKATVTEAKAMLDLGMTVADVAVYLRREEDAQRANKRVAA